MPQLTFHEAVERVGNEKGAAFACCPFTHEQPNPAEGDLLGANIYVVAHCSGYESLPNEIPKYYVHYVGGRYRTSSLVRERYWPESVPREAREATYRFLRKFDEAMLRGDLQAIHCELQRSAESV